MKYFITFALCTVVTIVLIHLVVKLLGLEPNNITLTVPILFLYLCFYGFSNPLAKNKE